MANRQRPNLTERPSTAADADKWVQGGDPAPAETTPAPAVAQAAAAPAPAAIPTPAPREATRRLTLDIPDSLHQAMKVRAAMTGVTMLAEVRAVLAQHYGVAPQDHD